jgi:hypothetical protein
MFKMPTAVTALFVAGMGLALTITLATCSQGGTASYRSPSQGGSGGSATNSQGGTGGSTPICTVYPYCNPGDQQVGVGQSGDCPAERECYSLSTTCGSVLCVLPEGVHCDDPVSCNPGDTRATGDAGCETSSLCYTITPCDQSVACTASASQYAGICSATSSGGGRLEPQDASADGDDAGIMHCCGDGIVDWIYGEQCDLRPLNGVCLDAHGNPAEAGCPIDTFGCSTTCMATVNPGP